MFASYQEEIMSNDTLHTDLPTPPSSHEAQQNGQPTTPIAVIDEAALAGSARASELIGSKVYKGDTSIGQIEDVLVDLDHGTSTAFILSLGGFLGIGKKLVAVPVNQIKVGSEANFMTDLTEAQLASAPEFDFGIVDQNFPDQKSVHAVSNA
jgi:sporulation protein YlmC with PRC-barrel domain